MSPDDEFGSRTTEELIRTSLQGGEDDEGAWEAIWALRRRGSRDVLDAACRLLHAASSKERIRGCDILGQLRGFPEESGAALCGLLQREIDPTVLLSAGVALGHRGEPRALADLVRLTRHQSAEVRYGAAHGLERIEDAEAIEALITLSTDANRDVRDRATFALGTIHEGIDTPRLRDALAARLLDEDAEIRGEALLGLARRKDTRAIEPTRAALQSEGVTVYALEAAAALGEASFLPLLRALKRDIGDADSHFSHVLDEVLQRLDAQEGKLADEVKPSNPPAPPDSPRKYLIARLRLLSTEEGGRRGFIASDYRPDWNIGKVSRDGRTELNGGRVFLEDRKRLLPGEEGIVRIVPLVDTLWAHIRPGMTLTMHEGAALKGHATVLDVITEETPRSSKT